MFIYNIFARSASDDLGLKDFCFIGKRLFIIPNVTDIFSLCNKVVLLAILFVWNSPTITVIKVFIVTYIKFAEVSQIKYLFSDRKLLFFVSFSLCLLPLNCLKGQINVYGSVDNVNVWKRCFSEFHFH